MPDRHSEQILLADRPCRSCPAVKQALAKRRWAGLFLALGILAITGTGLQAQQIPAQRGYHFQGLLWNPALTAPGNSWEAGAHYSQQWVSFPGAPASGWAYVQVPVERLNMSFGLISFMDQAGPFLHAGGQFNYAYRFSPGLASGDRFSFGILGRAGRMRFDPSQVVAREDADQLLSEDLSGEWSFDAGFGLFYTTHARLDFDRDAWYVGVVADQLMRSRLGFGGENDLWQGVPHGRFLAGYRNVRFSRCWEPSVYADLLPGVPVRAGAQLRYEQDRRYWAQAGGDLLGSVRMGGGYIFLPDPLGQRQLLIGVDAEYMLSPLGRQMGLSYHLSLAWRGAGL